MLYGATRDIFIRCLSVIDWRYFITRSLHLRFSTLLIIFLHDADCIIRQPREPFFISCMMVAADSSPILISHAIPVLIFRFVIEAESLFFTYLYIKYSPPRYLPVTIL